VLVQRLGHFQQFRFQIVRLFQRDRGDFRMASSLKAQTTFLPALAVAPAPVPAFAFPLSLVRPPAPALSTGACTAIFFFRAKNAAATRSGSLKIPAAFGGNFPTGAGCAAVFTVSK